MALGRILTLGLGNPFAGRKYLPTLGFGAFGTPPTPPSTVDTHDGFDEDIHRHAHEELEAQNKALRDRRRRLREALAYAIDPESFNAEPIEELLEAAAPVTERLESGTLRVDWDKLERDITLQAKLLALADEVRKFEEDEEDVMILLLH